MSLDDDRSQHPFPSSLIDDDLVISDARYEEEQDKFPEPPKVPVKSSRGGRGGSKPRGGSNKRITRPVPSESEEKKGNGVKSLMEQLKPEKRKLEFSPKKEKEPMIVTQDLNDDENETEKDAFSIILPKEQYEKSGFETYNLNKFINTPFDVYRKFSDKLDQYYLVRNSKNRYYVSCTPSGKCENLRQIGHYAMIVNYKRYNESNQIIDTPIVIGMKQKRLNVPYTAETLKVYEFRNVTDILDSKDVKMYIITTKKEYAEILFERILDSPILTFRNLKSRGMWVSTDAEEIVSTRPTASYAASSLEF